MNGCCQVCFRRDSQSKYRNGLDEEELLEPGKVYFFRIQMKGCAHSFDLTSSAVDSDELKLPKFDRNPNTNESSTMPGRCKRQCRQYIASLRLLGDRASKVELTPARGHRKAAVVARAGSVSKLCSSMLPANDVCALTPIG